MFTMGFHGYQAGGGVDAEEGCEIFTVGAELFHMEGW